MQMLSFPFNLSFFLCLSLSPPHVKAESTYLVSMAAPVRSRGKRQTGEGDKLSRVPCQSDGPISRRLTNACARLQCRVTETQTHSAALVLGGGGGAPPSGEGRRPIGRLLQACGQSRVSLCLGPGLEASTAPHSAEAAVSLDKGGGGLEWRVGVGVGAGGGQ